MADQDRLDAALDSVLGPGTAGTLRTLAAADAMRGAYLRYRVVRNGPGDYSVWACSALTGDRKYVDSSHSTRNGATAHARNLNAA